MKPESPAPIDRLRFAELMACLAAASELAMGQDADHVLQSCALALRIGQGRGLPDSELRNVYYQSLLRFIGCNAETGVMAAIAGDVLELRRAMAPLDMAQAPRVIAALVQRVRATHADASALASARAVLRSLSRAGEFARDIFPGHCEVAQRLGRRLGFDERFVTGLGQLYARWDGKGIPSVGGESILPASRIVVLAQELTLHHRLAGWPAAAAELLGRRGGQFEPALVDWVLGQGPALVADLPTRWDELSRLEPPPHDMLSGMGLDQALEVLADYADIQSGWLMTHTRRVAELAVDAARQLGMSPAAQRALRQAALLHDIGRVGVSTHVWDHPGPLGHSDLDRVRLHGIFTAQILRRAPTLAARNGVAALACAAHERLDGSGYAHGLEAAALSLSHRVLAAADVVAALGEARPHRPGHGVAAIEGIVGDEVRAGRLDHDASRAVLAVIGAGLAPAGATAAPPAGLSARECEVLVELCKGRTNKEIARALGISPKTVGHQVQSIYRKASVHTRAGATMFAIEQGLLRT